MKKITLIQAIEAMMQGKRIAHETDPSKWLGYHEDTRQCEFYSGQKFDLHQVLTTLNVEHMRMGYAHDAKCYMIWEDPCSIENIMKELGIIESDIDETK